MRPHHRRRCRCCDDVKGKENESHSQPFPLPRVLDDAVVTMSKVRKMKAIHNVLQFGSSLFAAVATMSKVRKMKAIHNCPVYVRRDRVAVVTMSKVRK